MNKSFYILIFLLLFNKFIYAQQLLQPVWVVTTTSSPPMVAMDLGSQTRGMDFTPAFGDQLIITSRDTNNVPYPYVVNVLDGTTTGMGFNNQGYLDTTGITGGLYPVNKVKIAEDGVIYIVNLTLAIDTIPLKIYRWQNSTSICVISVDTMIPLGNIPGRRFGDSIGIIG